MSAPDPDQNPESPRNPQEPRAEDINDPKMPLMEHLTELRKRVIIVVSAIGVLFLIGWPFSGEIMHIVERPLLRFAKPQFDTLMAPFMSHMKATFYAALFLTFPLAIAQLWLFVKPALYKREKQLIWPFLAFSYPLFVGGGSFFYFVVFPVAVEYLVTFDPTLVPSLRIDDFLSFTVTMLFIFGLTFEMPLVALLLTRMGILTPRMMSKFRRYAIVILAIAAAVITPTPDVVNMLLLFVPLWFLYEASIVICWMVKPLPKAEREQQE
jgi:sec-independent protein translocase protein TatC